MQALLQSRAVYTAVMSSTTPSVEIPGLNIRMNLRYPDKLQHFQEMMGSHYHCLSVTGAHTDMVLVCPEEYKSVRVSQFSASFALLLLKVVILKIK